MLENVPVLVLIIFYCITCPWTKVEESFNIQAVHDFLYERTNFSNVGFGFLYDHQSFPGVVPRTFVTPLLLSISCAPALVLVERVLNAPKYVMLVVARCTLGLGTFLCWDKFSCAVGQIFGRSAKIWLMIVTCSQFHFLFYASRTLPNVFANLFVLPVFTFWLQENYAPAVVLATLSTFLLRSELVLLFGAIFGPPIIFGRLNGVKAVKWGIVTLALGLVVTVPLDSFLWRQLIWPEASVWYYNVILNKSKDWGVQPFLWYFYSALPRSQGFSLILSILSAFVDGKCRKLLFPALFFIAIYSLLPHKELRFVVYTFPIFATCAAAFCAKISDAAFRKRKTSYSNTVWKMAFVACVFHVIGNCLMTIVLYKAASNNYPSGDGLAYLHRIDDLKSVSRPVKIHIDEFCAQNGVSRFLHLNKNWVYDKTENLSATQLRLRNFDFLCVGHYRNLTVTVREHTKIGSYRTLYTVAGFDSFKVDRIDSFPYFWPEFRNTDKVAMLGLRVGQ